MSDFDTEELLSDAETKIREQRAEINRLRITSEQRGKLIDGMEAEIEQLTRELSECRRLLREGIGFADMPESCFTPEIDARFVKWCNEAAKAGGEDE